MARALSSSGGLVRDWGRYRRPRRQPVPRAVWAAGASLLVAVAAVAIWRYAERPGWRPPSGLGGFAQCDLGGVTAECADVAVPRDPRLPHGATTALRVAVVPATDARAADALLYLEGGPGVPATSSAVEVNELFAEVGRTRDLVMVDQRGTGGSEPLACPDEGVHASDVAAVTAYLHTCFASLRGDPRLQTTAVAADDLAALRRRLGYARFDVYGASYAATLGEAFAARHPEAVRTLVLDSGSLPGVRIYDRSARNAEHALAAVLSRCARSRPCHASYPHPRADVSRLLARRPVRVTVEAGTARLGSDDLAWTISGMLESPSEAATIPYAVHRALAGDYTALGRAFFERVGPRIAGRARLAMGWEILCSERWAAWDPAATARLGRGSFLERAAVDRARAYRHECAAVPHGRVDAVPHTIGVPTLVLDGADDPLDPPANMAGWERVFPAARFVVVPFAGHGTIDDPCVQTMVARFVARGDARELDTSCVARVAALPFETG